MQVRAFLLCNLKIILWATAKVMLVMRAEVAFIGSLSTRLVNTDMGSNWTALVIVTNQGAGIDYFHFAADVLVRDTAIVFVLAEV